MSVTVSDLRDAPANAFLYCPDCGAEYSATHGDYSFWMTPDDVFTCQNDEHGQLPMVLATKRAVVELVQS